MTKLTPEQKQAVKESILRGFERQKFADWYNAGGAFDIFITNGNGPGETVPTKDEILGDIEDMLIPNL